MKVSTTTNNSPKEDAMKQSATTGKIYAGSGSRILKLDPEMFNKVFQAIKAIYAYYGHGRRV